MDAENHELEIDPKQAVQKNSRTKRIHNFNLITKISANEKEHMKK